jgi:hypothetical protein
LPNGLEQSLAHRLITSSRRSASCRRNAVAASCRLAA